jgi:hypothetical protein
LSDRPIAAFNDAITPSRSTNSLIAAIPAFGVSLRSDARTSTRRRRTRCRLRILLT